MFFCTVLVRLVVGIFYLVNQGRVRFGAANSTPPFGRWTFGRLDYRAPELGAGLLQGFF